MNNHREYRSIKPIFGVLLLLTTLFGCDGELEKEGELKAGSFAYRCLIAEVDPACSENFDRFPVNVAVGGRFHLDYTAQNGDDLRVIPASSHHVTADGALTGSAITIAGPAGFVALDNNSYALDLVHLYGWDIATIAFSDRAFPSHVSHLINEVELEPDETLQLHLIGFNDFQEPLAGTLSYALVIEDETITTVDAPVSNGLLTVTAQTEGHTRLTAVRDDLQVTLSIQVVAP